MYVTLGPYKFTYNFSSHTSLLPVVGIPYLSNFKFLLNTRAAIQGTKTTTETSASGANQRYSLAQAAQLITVSSAISYCSSNHRFFIAVGAALTTHASPRLNHHNERF
jgi:hypothetical protein